jgi:hypothetical protein
VNGSCRQAKNAEKQQNKTCTKIYEKKVIVSPPIELATEMIGTVEPVFSGWSGPILVKGGTPPLPRGGHTATFIENKLFVFGGNSYKHLPTTSKETSSLTTIVQDDLHLFDVVSSTWSKLSPKGFLVHTMLCLLQTKWCDQELDVLCVLGLCPSPRYAHSATAVGKKLVIFGGFNGKTYLDDIHILDTSMYSIYIMVHPVYMWH